MLTLLWRSIAVSRCMAKGNLCAGLFKAMLGWQVGPNKIMLAVLLAHSCLQARSVGSAVRRDDLWHQLTCTQYETALRVQHGRTQQEWCWVVSWMGSLMGNVCVCHAGGRHKCRRSDADTICAQLCYYPSIDFVQGRGVHKV